MMKMTSLENQSSWVRQEGTFHRLASNSFTWQSYTLLDYSNVWITEQLRGKPQLSPACCKQEIPQSVKQLLYPDALLHVPGLLTCVYDAGAHGVGSDHRSDNISASVRKGQLTSTLQKALLQLLEHMSALQGVQRPLQPAPQPSHTPRRFSEASRLQRPSSSLLAQEHKGNQTRRDSTFIQTFVQH